MSYNIIKDKSLTIWSILFVIIIFILQLILVYGLYQSKMSLMKREVELIFVEAYSIDLDKRIEYRKIQQENQIKLLENKDVSEFNIIDSLKKTVYNKAQQNTFLQSSNLLSSIDIAIEEDVSKSFPLKIDDLNIFIDLLLKSRSLTLPYNVVLFNPEKNEILGQTNPSLKKSSLTITSKSIPLNFKGNEVVFVYVNSNISALYSLGWLLVLSLILSVFCVYCLYYQLSALSKQKELAKSKNSFFSEVSHEMVRPLSVITQALDSLRNERTINDPVKRDRYITFAQVEIDKIAKKIDMVLSLARDDEGMFELNIKRIDLVKLVYDEVDSILVVPPKEVDFDIDNQLSDNPYINADMEHLEQILSNLIGNSIKYSDKYLSIIIKLYRDMENVYISVKDTGYGISKDAQKFIFEKYSRVDTHSKKGYGIGLNYVKRVVIKHGGEISLNSALGEGSEFIIRLPQNNSSN